MEMSLRGISSLPAARHSGVDDSVESVLQWISFLEEEWLIVFDNADVPPPEVVEKFIPPGNGVLENGKPLPSFLSIFFIPYY